MSLQKVNMFKLSPLGLCALLCASLLLFSAQGAAAKRVALIIGNDSYQGLPKLYNARADARGINTKLQALGFDTVLALNTSLRDIGKSLQKFEIKLQNADVGLVFYAGHGIQASGENYLIPVDAKLEDEADLNFGGGVPLKQVIASMERAGSALNLIILDACRDNPLPKSGRSSGTGRGLAVSSVPAGLGAKGTAILYSAAPGQIAQDGPRGGNGVFTGALLKVIATPGIPVEQVFKKTAALVSDKTGGKQEPWMNSSIKGDFYFKTGKAPTQIERMVPTGDYDKETIFWKAIADSKDSTDYKAYLAQYPSGSFVHLATKRMKQYAQPVSPEFEVASINKKMWVAKNSSVNIRSGPSTKFDKVGKLKGHGEVLITGSVKGSSWVRIALSTGDEGYVLSSLLDTEKPTKQKVFSVKTKNNKGEVWARHILVKTKAKAEEMIFKLGKGMDFAKLAAQYSIGPSRNNGGDLKWFEYSQMVRPFADEAFSLDVGRHSSKPIKTQFGWHIVKVEGFRAKPKQNEIHARHILLSSKSDAKMVINLLKQGEDFVSLAKKRSLGPSGPSGGDLGWFKKKMMVPEFEVVAFALKVGEYSLKPVKTQFGWHVIKLEGRR